MLGQAVVVNGLKCLGNGMPGIPPGSLVRL